MRRCGADGAELILVTKEQGMEGARDLALEMANRGEGKLLDQFNNPDNPYAHYTTTGPEIWQQTGGRITHFVSSMENWHASHRRFTLYARTIQTSNDRWPAGRRQQYSRHSPLACGIICRGFSTLLWWMRCWIFISAMQKTPCANWQCGKEYSVASAPAARLPEHCGWQS